MSAPGRPFDGVRVLEVTTGLAARTTGMLLADLGADVVRVVDRPLDRRSATGLYADRGKTLAVIDPACTGGPGDLRRLADAADVIVADAVPGALERRGLDALTCRSRNATLVHAWMPPVGTRGRASLLGPDHLLLAALSGFADHHPALEDRPVAPVTPVMHPIHGALGAVAVAAALHERERTGRGRSVTVTGLHAAAATLGTVMAEALDADRVISPGRGLRGAPNFRLYRSGDGTWVFLAALTPDIFFRALEVLGRMDVLARDDVAGEFTNLMLPAVANAVGGELEAAFATRPGADWLAALADADVPAAPARPRDAWLDSAVVADNRQRLEMADPDVGPVVMPGVPVALSVTPGAVAHLATPEHQRSGATVWTGHRPAPPVGVPESDPARPLPLSGLSVVDLATFLAAPFAATVLADLGAEVVKVEPPDGDPYRVFSVAYTAMNQRKAAATLDLRDPAGRSALLALVGGADVVIDNLRPASLARLGLDDAALAATNPALVRASVTAFGERGEWADRPGFDPVLQALAGLAVAQGGAGEPVSVTCPLHDVAAGALAALGILAALRVRPTVGGQRVTTSLAAAAGFLQGVELTTFPGRRPPQVGGADFPGPEAARRYYRCADGWLAVAATSAAHRDGLCEVTGLSPYVLDADLVDQLGAQLAVGRVVDWLDTLGARGVPAAAVLSRHGELRDPLLVANGFSHVVADPDLGRLRVVATFARWHGSPPRPGAGRRLGQDTRAVLAAAGVAGADLDRLAPPPG